MALNDSFGRFLQVMVEKQQPKFGSLWEESDDGETYFYGDDDGFTGSADFFANIDAYQEEYGDEDVISESDEKEPDDSQFIKDVREEESSSDSLKDNISAEQSVTGYHNSFSVPLKNAFSLRQKVQGEKVPDLEQATEDLQNIGTLEDTIDKSAEILFNNVVQSTSSPSLVDDQPRRTQEEFLRNRNFTASDKKLPDNVRTKYFRDFPAVLFDELQKEFSPGINDKDVVVLWVLTHGTTEMYKNVESSLSPYQKEMFAQLKAEMRNSTDAKVDILLQRQSKQNKRLDILEAMLGYLIYCQVGFRQNQFSFNDLETFDIREDRLPSFLMDLDQQLELLRNDMAIKKGRPRRRKRR